MAQSLEARSGAPPYFAYRSALVFCAPMIVNGIALPYFPVWLDSIDMDASQIAMILAVPMVLRVLVAPLISMLADRLGERVKVLFWSSILSFLSAIALFWSEAFWPVVIIFGLQGAFYAPYVPVTEAILMTGVRRWGFDYGAMRLWGSLAFIGSTTLIGILIGYYGGGAVLPAMAAGFVLTILAAFIAPRTGRPSPVAEMGKPAKSALLQLDFLLLIIGASLSQSSHALLYVYSSLDWARVGFSGTQIGLLWSTGVFAEVLVFTFSRQLSRRFSSWHLIIFGIVMAILRWTMFPIHGGIAYSFALQCLHAFTFATTHLGIQNAIISRVQARQEASAQGVYLFFNGSFMALSTFISGFLYVAFGMSGYYGMAAIAALGLAFVLKSRMLHPQSAIVGGDTREPA